jgi:hypothetical protein
LTDRRKSLKCAPLASVAELVDAPDSKSGALKACRFESDHWHQTRKIKGLQQCKPFFIAPNIATQTHQGGAMGAHLKKPSKPRQFWPPPPTHH